MLWSGEGGPTMPALAIRDDISSEELRRRARRESDGRVSARLIAIANALEGMDRASAARLAGMDRQTLREARIFVLSQKEGANRCPYPARRIGLPWRRPSSAQASSVIRGMKGMLRPRLVTPASRYT